MKKCDIALNDKLISIIQPTNCLPKKKIFFIWNKFT